MAVSTFTPGGPAIPGSTIPGGFLGAPAESPPGLPVIGTTPVLVAAAAPAPRPGVAGWCWLVNGSTVIYLGGAHVTSASGLAVGAGQTVALPVFAGDQLWACTAAGTSTITILATGA